MDMEAKIKELENNKEFMDKIAGFDSLADVAKAFGEEGVEVTEDDLKNVQELYEAQGGEITEDQLENVSGGVFVTGAAVIAGGCFMLWWGVKKGRGFLG